MVKHAQECCLEGKPELKSYRRREQNVVLFFNCVYRLVGASFGGRYTASDKFDPVQQVLVDKLKKHAYEQLDRLIDDHVMIDNSPVPVHMDTDAGAGSSYMSSAIQQNLSGHFAAHQEATEGLRYAQAEPSCANANNAPGPISYIPGHHNTRNYQDGDISAADDLSQVQTEPSCANTNNDPGSSSPLPDPHNTRNYPDQGTWLADQEPNDLLQGLLGRLYSCNWTADFTVYGDDGLMHQPHTIVWPGNGILEASTSAHTNMTLTRQQLTVPGAPGSAQGSIQSQMQVSLPDNGASEEASASAQQALQPQQWSQCQGNMP
uniref:Calmodulin binding protein C-terminal domain-containing protein n=1 Tax=Arundo donax TaxID=35708 RepID=A0A0A9CUX3_ARUDO